MSDVTRILNSAQTGDPRAAEELLPLVYQELRRLAAVKMAREKPGQTLQPTALVHEAWLRLAGNQEAHWQGRAHFFGAAAEAMRRILIDRARRRKALRRGGDPHKVDVDEVDLPAPGDDDEILAVHEVLEQLAAQDPRKAELVKLRYFVGLNFEETAEVLGIAVPTAKQWWAYARAWLLTEMKKDQPD
jgi:RNA polymerase sigma factor (TIGR02999 family)